MLRPGLHFGNTSAVTDADLDIIRRWSPLSLLLAMDNIVMDNQQINRLKYAWELGGKPEIVLRKYFYPDESNYNGWGKHAHESIAMAARCINVGIPVGKLILKPFNEPNMPTWAMNQPHGEGFGDKPEQISKYNEALHRFVDIVRQEMPGLRIGGPHLTVGNRDARMGQDPQAEYYYHGTDGKFASSRCYGSLIRLDCHFVHCYGMHPGEHLSPYHGLRFVEYCKYMGTQKPVYIVEGTYGMGSGESWLTDQTRGQETVEYLKELDKYPYVKGIALWIGGDRGWDAFRFSDGNTHRPVVFAVEKACKEGSTPPPPPPPPPPEEPTGLKIYDNDGNEKDWAWVKAKYNVAIEPHPLEWAYRVIELREQIGPASVDVWVQDMDGRPISGDGVAFRWPDGAHHEITDIGGKTGFAYGPGAYYFPPTCGPHWIYVLAAASETVRCLGMLAGTNHAHLNITFRYQRQEPPEEEKPMPAYTFLKALETYGIEYIDHRPEVLKMIAEQELTPLERSKTDPLGSVKGIVVHHSAKSGESDPTPMAIASYHIKNQKWPGCAYTFVITKDGIVHFMMPIKYVGYHSGREVVNYASLGVCFVGDFTTEEPTVEQLASFLELRAALEELFGGGWDKWRDMWIVPHKWITATVCPGQNLEHAILWF